MCLLDWTLKTLMKEERKVKKIHLAVRYFDKRMKKQSERLLECMHKSREGTYNRCVPEWKTAYDAIIKDKYRQT